MSESSSVNCSSDGIADPRIDFREDEAKCLSIALVNNMPSAAVEDTERQFRARLAAAADGLLVRLAFYQIPEVPRTEAVRQRLARYYRNTDDLWDGHFDAVIVTGSEPRAANLTEEPYWRTFTRLVEWAEENTYSAIWSCLAAHATVLYLDGIIRRRLPEKRFGVFECAKSLAHCLMASVPARFSMPHSRWNDLPEDAITICGYRPLSGSGEAGVDTFVREGSSLFVFFQGHPEYEAETLLLEYRRDVRRFLKGEQDYYPSMPKAYFDGSTAAALAALQDRILLDRREERLAEFPAAIAAGTVQNTWNPVASRIYRNWLLYVSAQKKRRLRTKARRSTRQAIGTGQAA